MNPLFQAAMEIQQFLQERGWRFCIIGGLAVVRWGEPRATQDVNVTLLTGLGSEEQYIDTLLEHFNGRHPDTRQFALQNRVVLLSARNGVPLDITLAAYSYEGQIVSRASSFEFAPGISLVTASAEDLVVLKAVAGRDQDWNDIEGIAVRQSGGLNWDYIIKEFTPLGEIMGDDAALRRLEQIRQREHDPE